MRFKPVPLMTWTLMGVFSLAEEKYNVLAAHAEIGHQSGPVQTVETMMQTWLSMGDVQISHPPYL